MIRVCDAIMGSGKSMSAITYMNEHRDRKFIYITPYLSEAARIKKGCPSLGFVEPSANLEQYKFKKSLHTAALIAEGKNITTTHQAFRGYTHETLEMIKEKGYTLIIDENVEILEQFQIHRDDVGLALSAGYIKENNGIYTISNLQYKGNALKELLTMMKSRELIRVDDGDSCLFYWALPPELITAFQDVFILTYLFEGQSLHHLLEIYNIPYSYIGIHKNEDGTFRFGELPGYTPEYIHHMRDKIHIFNNDKFNSVGDDYYSMSQNWYDRNDVEITQLKNNIYNYFRNVMGDIPAEQRLCGAFKDHFNKVKGRGYTKSFLTFNAKATNEYRNCNALVYISNVFMNVNEKNFYKMHGIEVDQDMYALSIVVQWVWRSAIRDGNEVFLYIPSSRMRGILERWIDSFDEVSTPVEEGKKNEE